MKPKVLLFWMAGALVLVAVLVGGNALAGSYFDKRDVTTKVISKERVCDGGKDGSCRYLVFTDAGTFKVTDAAFGTTRFNSSDFYGRIREDRCYRFSVYGWRFGPTSSYPNIAEASEVPCGGAS